VLAAVQAANLNNCLKNVIYTAPAAADATAPPAAAAAAVGTGTTNSAAAAAAPGSVEAAAEAAIPAQELVVVFDADMVCKPGFFRHVSNSLKCVNRWMIDHA
jgi:tetrahydromethanopterin S-methyltransferase subunit D